MAYENNDYLSQNDINKLVDALNKEGVLSGLAVSINTGLTVDIAAGTAKIGGTKVTYAGGSVTLTSADATYPRKDIIVIDNTGTVSAVAGTAQTPLPAANTGRQTYQPLPANIPANSIILAEIWVGAGVTTLLSAHLEDARVFINDIDDITLEESSGLFQIKDGGVTAAKLAESYYQESEFIATSTGVADAGKPVKTDADGNIDATLINDADIDHTLIQNIGTNTHAQIDTHIADTTIHYVKSDIMLDEISSSVGGDQTFNFNANTITWQFTNPVGGVTYNWSGGASGHLFTLVESGGSPAGTHLLHVEAQDLNTVAAHFTNSAAGGVAILVNDGIVDLSNADSIVLSHTALQDIGTNTHAQIDTHIADSTIHFTQASISLTKSQVSDFNESDYVHTTGDETIAGVKTFSNNVIVSGDLIVNGTVTTVNSETVLIADNIITLNSNVTGTPTENGGIEIERGTSTNASLLWDETADKWKAGLSGSEIELVDLSSTQTLTNKSLTVSQISDLTNGVESLTSGEVTQLANIDSTTISTTQWGYVGALNQSLATTSSPTFNNLLVTDQIRKSDDATTYLDFNTGLWRLYANAKEYLRLSDTAGEVVVNEDSNDIDFRVESDVFTHSFFVRGSDGYVGIGTTNPLAKLSVDGYLKISGENNAWVDQKLLFSGDGTGYQLKIGSMNNAGTINTPIMTLQDNGYVGIGTTSPGAKTEIFTSSGKGLIIDSDETADQILRIEGAGNSKSSIYITESGATGTGIDSIVSFNQFASGTGDVLGIRNDGTGQGFFIDQNGNGKGLFIDSEATTEPSLLIEQDLVSDGSYIARIDHAGGNFRWGITYETAVTNTTTMVLGGYHIWVDATGVLRIKSSAPTTDTDGTVVGTQT